MVEVFSKWGLEEGRKFIPAMALKGILGSRQFLRCSTGTFSLVHVQNRWLLFNGTNNFNKGTLHDSVLLSWQTKSFLNLSILLFVPLLTINVAKSSQ
jgi:hypothetical protein